MTMLKIAARLISFLSLSALTLLSFAGQVSACTCYEHGVPPCAAYGRADAVFVGVVVDIKTPPEDTASFSDRAIVRFTIEEAYKGVKGSEVEIATLWGTSCDYRFVKGERYLVYAHRDKASGRLENQPCDRTTHFSHADEDLSYIRGLSKGAREQFILGKVVEQRYIPLPGIKITVEGAGKKYTAVTDDEGNFEVSLARAGIYKVRAVTPFSAEAFNYKTELTSRPTEKQSVIEYQADIKKGQCDYTQLDVYKVDLKATAEIGGRITDIEGKPVGSMTVYLYPAREGQDFSSGDYEHTQTDKDGRYSFKGLREGDFWLGINLNKTPTVGEPYPKTFYPGVPDLSQATVITLEQGQKLTKNDFSLPPKLVEREVTGVIVWPDGRPVTKLSPTAKIGPSLSVLDLLNDLVPISPFRKDGTNTEKTDEEGRFSFIGFEGYSYVIKAHAFNDRDEVMHAKSIKITINGEVKPIKLVLSRPGYGESREEMKKEFDVQP